jgi:hypothetical protein
MNLPEGLTCADCVHVRMCTRIFGAKKTDTSCQFFPRGFREKGEIDKAIEKWNSLQESLSEVGRK